MPITMDIKNVVAAAGGEEVIEQKSIVRSAEKCSFKTEERGVSSVP